MQTSTRRLLPALAGADDYLAKPFDLDELSARLRALCRRVPDTAGALRVGRGLLDLAVRDVILPGGGRVALSAREFELLRVLALRPRQVHSRAQLRSRVFDGAAAASLVDTYVYYLRRRLLPTPQTRPRRRPHRPRPRLLPGCAVNAGPGRGDRPGPHGRLAHP